jgi:HEAT repeat protein
MLEREQDPGALSAILFALSHNKAPKAIKYVSRFRRHPDPEVRRGVVFALLGYEDQTAHGVLIELTRDRDVEVRDWATFGIGTQCEADTPAIRDALADRLADSDDVTRCEALVGLARRRDPRALTGLQKELARESVDTLALEAAAFLGDPLLRPRLVALRGRRDVDREFLDDAIRACSLA